MKTDLELEFKATTGSRPSLRNGYCPKCDKWIGEELYISEYVDFLIAKIEELSKKIIDTKSMEEELDDLRDQLRYAEDEISELNNNL